jgi:hypothetical protein
MFAKEGDELKVGVGFIKGEKRLAILVFDEQPADGSRKDVRIDPDLANGGLAVELFGELPGGQDFDDPREDQESEDGIEEQRTDGPNDELAFARAQRVPEAKQARFHGTVIQVRRMTR